MATNQLYVLKHEYYALHREISFYISVERQWRDTAIARIIRFGCQQASAAFCISEFSEIVILYVLLYRMYTMYCIESHSQMERKI